MVIRTNRMAYDKTEPSSMLIKDDGSPIADSSKAHRILSGCVGNLSSDDMMSVAEMLEGKGLLSKSELESLKSAMSGSKDDDDVMATDSVTSRGRANAARQPSAEDTKRFKEMFPHADRITQL